MYIWTSLYARSRLNNQKVSDFIKLIGQKTVFFDLFLIPLQLKTTSPPKPVVNI